jgi:hypothetical protein
LIPPVGRLRPGRTCGTSDYLNVTPADARVPSLRNLELTVPYFSQRRTRTIRQIVEFYNRGCDFREYNVLKIDFEIGKLNLTAQQIQRSRRVSRPTADRPAGYLQ